jgi:hypothetical protein
MKYKYKLKNTRFSSEQLENCEVCGKYVGEVFFQTEAKGYVSAFDKRPPVTLRWTHHIALNLSARKEQFSPRALMNAKD